MWKQVSSLFIAFGVLIAIFFVVFIWFASVGGTIMIEIPTAVP